MKTYSVNGTYGSSNIPCIVFVYPDRFLVSWYCVNGSLTVNATTDEIKDGVNVEELSDTDCFTWSSPILSLEDLERAVEN